MSNADPYDEVAYPGFPFPQTHPDRLATIAILFGMTPKSVTECRVLELGCGEGANLIPIAHGLPRSKFIGIDLAARALGRGQTAVAALGLRNIELRRMNVLDVTADFGQFDYIIAHGLFSWVPLQVQEKILTLCEELLTPQGVAYISYNTYPGSHLRQMTREMMLFHLNAETDPKIRLSKARDLIKSMSEAETANDYSAFLSQEFARIAECSDAALYHDDLAETNTPYYFSHFMEKARRHGLQYLAEARLAECQNNIYPAIANDLGVAHEDPIIANEQYFDFLKCRMFRQTLLCHKSVQVDRSLNIDRLRKLFVASSAQPVSANPDLQSPGVVEKFHLTSGATISIDLPVAKVALAYLREVWPRSMGIEELLARTHHPHLCSHLDVGDSDSHMTGLCEAILKIYGADLLNLHSYQQTIASKAGEDPIASSVARLQARDKSTVTTLRHTTVELKDVLGRHLLLLLDGTRDRPALLKDLSAEAKRQAITLSKKVDLEDLERKLGELARLALLVA